MLNTDQQVRLAITMGDPAGIGAEVISDLITRDAPPEHGAWFIVGDADVLHRLSSSIENAGWLERTDTQPSTPPENGTVTIWDPSETSFEQEERGTASAKSGTASMDYLVGAYRLLEEDLVNGLVTGPVSKKAISRSDQPFYGQTEWLASKTGTKYPVMGMTWNDWLAVTVTRHIPVRKIPLQLSSERIAQTVQKTADGLTRYFGIPEPEIGVCGLNPHAGEQGLIGNEEIDMIGPALEEARSDDLQIDGPHSAEHLFTEKEGSRLDAVVTMYHDQAMLPLKSKGLDACAAVTLGLDMIRTSVAHGTGYELVGTETYSHSSLVNSIQLATKMIRHDVRA